MFRYWRAHVELERGPRLGVDDLAGGALEQRDVPAEQIVVEITDDQADLRRAGAFRAAGRDG